MQQEYEDNPAYGDELKEIVIKWIKSFCIYKTYMKML